MRKMGVLDATFRSQARLQTALRVVHRNTRRI